MISLIFLAGGRGSRMGTPLPKQFLPLGDKPVALHSLELFFKIKEISEVIIVCDPIYQVYFLKTPQPLKFALPGDRRQDSVYNGLQQCNPTSEFILIHDSARPFLERTHLEALIQAGQEIGAGTLAVPVSSTIKQANRENTVERTLDRSTLWEIQTPQILSASLLRKGFEKIQKMNLEVTDDVSIAEVMEHPVKIVPGSNKNFKLTTPFDLEVAKTWEKRLYDTQ